MHEQDKGNAWCWLEASKHTIQGNEKAGAMGREGRDGYPQAGDLELGSVGLFGFGNRTGLIKTDLMRGVERPWSQRSLVLDGGCGGCF